MNSELVNYIKNEIFPLYNRNEEGHGINHIKTVIKRSLELAQNYDVNIDMVYTIAAYHDLGHYIDRKTHEIISAEKYGENGYAKIYLEDKEFEEALQKLRQVLSNKEEFIERVKK